MAPRGVQARLDWFLSHNPSGVGMCAQHSWHALGGNYGDPPAWGCRNANEVYRKVKASGKYGTGTPPRGALVLWSYGANGHAALYYGDGKIATTDPSGKPGKTGLEDINYPVKWGATKNKWIWTSRYNGVDFPVGEDAPTPKYTDKIDSSLLGSGQPADGKPQGTLQELQYRLNNTSLKGGRTLPITGLFDAATEHEVQLWQRQICGDEPDPDGRVTLGPKQRQRMFPTPPYTIVDKGLPPAPSGGTGTAEPEWATRMRRALARVTAPVDYRPRWTDPAIAGKHSWHPSWVVLHHTAGTNSLRWIEDGADHPPVPASHFLIDRDGTVHVFSCHETYHAGDGGPLGDVAAKRMNSYAWGIEIESEGKVFDFTAEQIQSARELCAGLVEECGVVASTEPDGPWQIVNHSTWNPNKTDTLQPDAWWREQITAELTGTTPPTEETPVTTTINVADLRHGVQGSPSVAWWQRKLNGVKLVGGSTLPDTGNFLDRTKRETALWQDQKADDKSVTDGSRVTAAQVRQMDPSVILADDAGGAGSSSGSFIQLVDYWFSDKPPGKQPLKTAYVALDDNDRYSTYRCPEDGLLLSMVYVNVHFAGLKGATGQLRTRLMRLGPEDATAHQDYTVGATNTVQKEFVFGKVWFGKGDKDRRYRWEVDSAGFTSAEMTTRYCKFAFIPQRVIVQAARTFGVPEDAIANAIIAIFKWFASEEIQNGEATTVDLRDDDPDDDDGPVPAELVAP